MSGNYDRARVWIKFEALWREIFISCFADKENSVRISEFPKSGGSWLGEMLSDAMSLEFPRNTFPFNKNAIFHGHSLKKSRINTNVVVWRDPRDVMVSWYHHCIIGNSHVNPSFVQQCRRSFKVDDYENVKENMPKFIRWAFDYPPSPGFNWSDFFDAWEANCAEWVRYEDLHAAPVATLTDLIFKISGEVPERDVVGEIVERHSFKNRSGRQYGEEDKKSFLRKGVVGDWKNYFDDDALMELKKRVGSRAEKLGYE